MRFINLGSDEGSLLCGAERIVYGQVYARDFFELMGPGTFYWLAAFFKLFGVTMLARQVCLFISSLGTITAMFFLTRQICKQYAILPCVILAGTYFGAAWPGISHHVDSNFLGLWSVVFMVLWHTRRKGIFLIAAGALAGVTTCVLQPKGGLLFFAFVLWLWLERRKIASLLPSLGILTASYCSIIALVGMYFWHKGALSSLVYADFISPSQSYSSVNAVAYGQGLIKDYWTPWTMIGSGSRSSVVVAVILIVPFIFILLLPILSLVPVVRRKWRSLKPEMVLYFLAGWAFWMGESHRKDIYHLVFGAPLLIVLCVHTLSESRTKLRITVLRTLTLSAWLLAGFNFVLVAFAAHPVVTPVGNAYLLGSDTTFTFLRDHVSQGEEILVYPYAPIYYFLSGTNNPTRYSMLVYNYNTPAQFQEAVRTLDQRQVRYVVWDTEFLSRTSKEIFPGSMPKSSRDLIIEPYLESHYRVVQEDHGICILERITRD